MMSRKHYKVIAEQIWGHWLANDCRTDIYMDYLIANLARAFQADNPNFSITHFYRSCGLSEENSGEFLSRTELGIDTGIPRTYLTKRPKNDDLV